MVLQIRLVVVVVVVVVVDSRAQFQPQSKCPAVQFVSVGNFNTESIFSPH